MLDLPLIWGVLIAVGVFMYVVLDGFDLGIGILFPLFGEGDERDTAMNTVAPVWDGNETWLVLGGGGLLAAFPLAYTVIMPAVYAPIIIMLLGLIFRGVAFEFRWRDKAHEKWWDRGFATGSITAAFCQGIVLGTLVQGIEVDGRAYAGGWFDWVTPFSLICGVGVVIGYSLLGATWLLLKTEGELQAQAYRFALPAAIGILVMMAAVSLWTPFLDPSIEAFWFTWPNIALLSPIPLIAAIAGLVLLWALVTKRENLPFPLALVLFLTGFLGIGLSFYPYVVPYEITLWDAAAPDASLGFMLVGAVVLLPLILAYTGYAYWVFRGKVRPGEGYH